MDDKIRSSLKYIYRQQRELSMIGGIGALLGWDQMTYMPPDGTSERAEQTAFISKISHKKIISNTLWKHISLLSKPSNFETLTRRDQIVIGRLKKDVEKARKIPSSFVEKLVKTTIISYQAWGDAKRKSDFKLFAPYLEKIVELKKEYSNYINLPGSPYNSLLDDYEEGMTVDRLGVEFSYLESNLTRILEKIKDSNRYQKQNFKIKLSSNKQRKLCERILKRMGLPKNKTRMDESMHPFTISIGYDDVRITTAFKKENPLTSIFAAIHEGGHALYELGMPQGEYKYTVISDAPSLGLHESQSRFWENMIARSKEFWQYFTPTIKKTIGDIDQWYQMINQVKPSFIRVEADELTYSLHIILRFELESKLMDGKIDVKDLPQIWNEKMDKLLGIIPKNDREGVLQDMHWSEGHIGYFPTYAIGNIYAAQLFQRLLEEKPEIKEEIRNGVFTSILEWLRHNVHRYGRMITADEIIKQACGEGLKAEKFISYLENKYFELYEV